MKVYTPTATICCRILQYINTFLNSYVNVLSNVFQNMLVYFSNVSSIILDFTNEINVQVNVKILELIELICFSNVSFIILGFINEANLSTTKCKNIEINLTIL